ncbi:hypothetical protein GCM10027043_01880 [Ferruginibacter profundus]
MGFFMVKVIYNQNQLIISATNYMPVAATKMSCVKTNNFKWFPEKRGPDKNPTPVKRFKIL